MNSRRPLPSHLHVLQTHPILKELINQWLWHGRRFVHFFNERLYLLCGKFSSCWWKKQNNLNLLLNHSNTTMQFILLQAYNWIIEHLLQKILQQLERTCFFHHHFFLRELGKGRHRVLPSSMIAVNFHYPRCRTTTFCITNSCIYTLQTKTPSTKHYAWNE